MGGEWIEAPLGDLVDIFDGPHATPAKADDGPIFLGISNLNGGRLDLTQTEHISEHDYGRWTRRVTPRTNDIVFSYETRLGEAARVPPGLRCCLGRRMGLLRAKPGKVDPRFLLYAYLGPAFQETIRARTIRGSTVDRIPLIEMGTFPIRVPTSLDDQRSIAHILGTLDDKIELNRRMNETLEAMARALFKSWFVDFDPVRAKAERRDPGLPKHLADLFPDSFEESELGEIPKGWEVCRWRDLISLEYGRALRGYDSSAGRYPVFGTNGRIGTCGEPLCSHPGIIIGRKGAYRGIHFSPTPFYVIDTAFYVEPKVPLELHWAYYEMRRTDLDDMDSGSAIPSTNRDEFYALPLVAPPFAVQQAFVRVLSSAWERQRQGVAESDALARFRDTLLPKLISGELSLKGADCLMTGRS